MPKRKPKSKKEVHQPDDKLFKEVMEQPANAIEYIKTYYAELADQLELSTFQVEREKLSVPNFKTFEADIVYTCKFKDSDEDLNISLLWENKSEPDEYIFIQIGLYLFLRYYKMVKSSDLELEPIIPLVFYNGKRDWVPKDLEALLKNHTFLEVFKKYLPQFDFHFTNIRKVPTEELLKIKTAFFRSAMIAMANKYDYNLLLQFFPVIFEVGERDAQVTMLTYIFGVHERLPEQVKKDVSPFSINIQEIVMGTFANFKEEGKIEERIEVAQNMHNNGFTIEQICIALKESEEFVKKAIATKKK